MAFSARGRGAKYPPGGDRARMEGQSTKLSQSVDWKIDLVTQVHKLPLWVQYPNSNCYTVNGTCTWEPERIWMQFGQLLSLSALLFNTLIRSYHFGDLHMSTNIFPIVDFHKEKKTSSTQLKWDIVGLKKPPSKNPMTSRKTTTGCSHEMSDMKNTKNPTTSPTKSYTKLWPFLSSDGLFLNFRKKRSVNMSNSRYLSLYSWYSRLNISYSQYPSSSLLRLLQVAGLKRTKAILCTTRRCKGFKHQGGKNKGSYRIFFWEPTLPGLGLDPYVIPFRTGPRAMTQKCPQTIHIRSLRNNLTTVSISKISKCLVA